MSSDIDPTTPAGRAELRRLADAACLPWEARWWFSMGIHGMTLVTAESDVIADNKSPVPWGGEYEKLLKGSTEYLIAAANAVPTLLDRLEAVEGERDRLRVELSREREAWQRHLEAWEYG